MVILGLGDLRKPKDYLIPLSSILFGASLGVMAGAFTDYLRIFLNFIGFGFFVSFAPFIWIIPLLTKLWLDSIEKDEISE